MSKKKAAPKKKRYPKPANFVPDLVFDNGHRYAGRPRCQAWNPNKGEQCSKLPVKGSGHPREPYKYKTVCRSHGGASPRGVDHPSFRHGRWSVAMPDNLISSYEARFNDPDILALEDEIALVDTMIGGEIPSLTNSSAEWYKAGIAFNHLMDASSRANLEEIRRYSEELSEVFESGLEADRSRGRILDLLESRRKLVETERRRLVDLQYYMTVEKIRNVAAAVADIIRAHVKDEESRRLISDAIRAVFSGYYSRPNLPTGTE